MANETDTKAAESDAPKHTHKATLVNGEVYYLGNQRFDKGKARPVTAAEKDELDGAVFHETILGPNDEAKSRAVKHFEFKSIGAEEDDDENDEGDDEEVPNTRSHPSTW